MVKKNCCDTTQFSDCNVSYIKVKPINCANIGKTRYNIELGTNYQSNKFNPFVNIGLRKELFYFEYAGFLGVDYYKNISLSLRFQYIPFRVFNSTINPISWFGINKFNNRNYYSKLFVGSEIKPSYSNQFAVNQDVHLGVSTEPDYISFFAPKFFVKYGVETNYLQPKLEFNRKFTFGINLFL